GADLLLDGGTQLTQQVKGEREIAATILPERRRADADAPRQLTGRPGEQFQAREELFQRLAGTGIQAPQLFQLLRRGSLLLTEAKQLLQDAARGRMQSQLQVAEGAAPDAAAARQLQACQSERLRAQLHNRPCQGRCGPGTVERTLTQMRIS